MYIKRIELKDFRNYKELDVVFNENVNIFIKILIDNNLLL